MPVWNRAKKEEYFERVEELLGSYNKVLVVGVRFDPTQNRID